VRALQDVKSIDLTLDARRGLEIDDLVALSMDLWAVSQGYRRRRYCSCRTAFGSFP